MQHLLIYIPYLLFLCLLSYFHFHYNLLQALATDESNLYITSFDNRKALST